MPLADRGSGDGLLAEAVVPDPCFWTPESPFLYRVRVDLRSGDEVLAQAERLLGIRPLGARGKKLSLESRPWVLRGARQEAAGAAELVAWRAVATAVLVENPNDELLAEASRLGVMLVTRLSGDLATASEQLRRVSRWPAPALALLDEPYEFAAETLAAARNLPLAQRFGPGEAVRPARWAAVVVCQGTDLDDLARRAAECPLPVIVSRPSTQGATVASLRAECDRLQRDLAGRGEFAGYLV